MSECNLGKDAVISIGTVEWEDVSSHNVRLETAMADTSTRGGGGFRQWCPTLRDVTIDVSGFYKGSGVTDTVQAAWLDGVDVSVAVTDAGLNFPGDFFVESFEGSSPLEEGNQFNVTFRYRGPTAAE